MEKKKLIHLALGTLIMLPSCTQEDPARIEPQGDGNRIFFRSYLPNVAETRGQVITSDNFTTCQVICINPDDTESIDAASGEIRPYFTDICFTRDSQGRFFSQGDEKCKWPNTGNTLHFFAYYPSAESMKKRIGNSYFNLVNESGITDGNTNIGYRIDNFRIAANIADQVDFTSAYSTGSMHENNNTGIELDFRHQLARVEISAWGANEKYNFEIAGVRIGNAITGGDFHFTGNSGKEYPWTATEGQLAPVEHIFTTGESIVTLSQQTGSHTSDKDAASVMGNALSAMVIPMQQRIEAWEGQEDPLTKQTPYKTEKMYFSLLLRVTDTDGELVYPYPKDTDNIPVTYLAVENGKVSRRLYESGGRFYTDADLDEAKRYTPKATESILGFCWAALPVAAKWEAGKIYSYKLNYSTGIGWHDPSYPDPGKPIVKRVAIPFDVTVEEWKEGTKTDVTVPRK